MAEQASTTETVTPAATPVAAPVAAPAADTKPAAPAAETKPTEGAKPAAPESLLGGTGDRVGGEPTKPIEAKPIELKVGEGFDAKSPAVVEFAKLAAQEGWKPEVAQKVWDHFATEAKPLLEAQKAIQQAQSEAKSEVEGWLKDINSSFKPADLQVAIGHSRQAVAVLAERAGLNPAEVKEFLNSSQLGNHPFLFRMFAAAGRQMGEDRTTSTETKPAAGNGLERMYPSMFSKH